MTDFALATAVENVAEGEFKVELAREWTVGRKPHGGYLMAVLARAGTAAVDGADPLALSAEFLRPPEAGPAVVRTQVIKAGRTASVVALRLEQGDRACVTGTLTAGALPEEQPQWVSLPDFAAQPEDDSYNFGADPSVASNLAKLCDLRVSRLNASMLSGGEPGEPLLQRGWIRLPDESTDPYLTLVAGDVMPPLGFNIGKVGWSPTVQLTALLRARPAPGWLRVQTESRSVAGAWFDCDATVLDSAGRLVCQARQLALLPR